MNWLYRIKSFIFRNKIKQLPEIKEDKIENNQNNTFLQSLEIKDDPFSKLLNQEYMERIDIDKELQPIFKDEILKIRNYFLKNDLMPVKNFDEFFKNYLLDGKVQIRLANENELPNHASGIYQKNENQILIGENLGISHDLCHELIHFLVMADSNKLNWCPSQVPFLNEGYTELIASEIDNICPQAYLEGAEIARFLNLFSKTKNESIKAFLKDEFAFDGEYMWKSIYCNSNYYMNNGDIDSYRNIQREIINKLIDKDNIKSVQDYIQVINQLKQRPSFDKEYMEKYYSDLNNKFLENINLPVDEKTLNLLNRYCNSSYKAENFGDREIVEINLDDIDCCFDINGKTYGDIPNGQVSSQENNFIEFNHNGKKQKYSLKNFKGTNYVEELKKSKEEIYTFFGYKEKNARVVR